MNELSSFVSDKKFYADKHFPYGISRSGEFNRQQAGLLEDHGQAYQALHSGDRSPVNDEEREFVAVCKGDKPAQTAHEIVWIRFCQKTQKKTFIPLSSGKPELELDIGIDDFSSFNDEL